MSELKILNLEFSEIEQMISEPGLNVKAVILKKAINMNCFMRDVGGEKLYILQNENYYKQMNDEKRIESELKCLITSIIENSYNKLSEKEQFKLRDNFPKSYA